MANKFHIRGQGLVFDGFQTNQQYQHLLTFDTSSGQVGYFTGSAYGGGGNTTNNYYNTSSFIATGSVTASVNIGSTNIFNITSQSINLLSLSGDRTLGFTGSIRIGSNGLLSYSTGYLDTNSSIIITGPNGNPNAYGTANARILLHENTTGEFGGSIDFARSYSNNVIGADYTLGELNFYQAYATNTFAKNASIKVLSVSSSNATSSPGKITFGTTPSGSVTPVEIMVIMHNGNVGIGTTNPTYKLDVSGNTNIFGNTIITGSLNASGSSHNISGAINVSNGNISISGRSSTTANPRTVGITPWQSGNAARFTFGDELNSLQASNGGRVQLQSFWGMEIQGSRQTGTPLGFNTGNSADPSLNVYAGTAGNPALVITGFPGQTANLQQWRNNVTTVSSIDRNGYLTLNSATSTGNHVLNVNGNARISSSLEITGSLIFAPQTASSFSGEIVRFGAGTLTVGQLYFLSSSGTWSLTNANSTGSSTGMLGIATGTSPITDGLLIRGFAASSSYTYGTGSVVYMATGSGVMTSTAPSSSNHVVRVMGYQTSLSNTIYFDPDKTWVTLA